MRGCPRSTAASMPFRSNGCAPRRQLDSVCANRRSSFPKARSFSGTPQVLKMTTVQLYHGRVFDEVLEGTTALYSSRMLNDRFAQTEVLELFAVAELASGTPTLTVQLEESPDGIHWSNKNGTPEI